MKQEEISNIAPLLFTILRNNALDYLKHEEIKRIAHASIDEALNRELEIRISTLHSCDPEEIFSSEIVNISRQTLPSLSEKPGRYLK